MSKYGGNLKWPPSVTHSATSEMKNSHQYGEAADNNTLAASSFTFIHQDENGTRDPCTSGCEYEMYIMQCNNNIIMALVPGPQGTILKIAKFAVQLVLIVRENQDKGVTKRGTTLVFVYKIEKNVLF